MVLLVYIHARYTFIIIYGWEWEWDEYGTHIRRVAKILFEWFCPSEERD